MFYIDFNLNHTNVLQKPLLASDEYKQTEKMWFPPRMAFFLFCVENYLPIGHIRGNFLLSMV